MRFLNTFFRLGSRGLVLSHRRPPLHRCLHLSRPLAMPSWGPTPPKIDRKDIEFRVLQTLAKHDKIDVKALTLDTRLTSDLGLDSLDLIECCVELEDEFQISIEDSVVDQLLSVAAVVEYVVTQLNERPDELKRPEIEFKEGMTGNRPIVN